MVAYAAFAAEVEQLVTEIGVVYRLYLFVTGNL